MGAELPLVERLWERRSHALPQQDTTGHTLNIVKRVSPKNIFEITEEQLGKVFYQKMH